VLVLVPVLARGLGWEPAEQGRVPAAALVPGWACVPQVLMWLVQHRLA